MISTTKNLIAKSKQCQSDHWSPQEDKLLVKEIFKNNGKN